MKDKIVKLKNGGIMIYSRNKQNNSSAVEVGFCAGAECDRKMGTAHFLEHTLFKKTKTRTNAEVDRDRNKITFLNASTGMDYLVMKFYRTNKLIEQSMNFAEDVLMNSVIDDEYIESEKGVIKEELKMCLDDEHRDVYLKNFKQAITKPKFSSDIVGVSEENIDSITFEDIKKFKDDYFIGNNFIISIATSMPYLKTKRLVDKCFTSKIAYALNHKKTKRHYDMTDVDKKTSVKIYPQNQEKSTVLMTFKINANELDIFGKNYNYTFLGRYLSGSQGDLFLKLRNQGLVYRLNSDISTFKNTSLFNILFETSKEKIKQTVDVIKDEIKKVVTEKIDENLIAEYRKNLEYFADEKIPARMTAKCHVNLMDYMNYGKLFQLSKKQKKALRKGVTPDGVLEVAKEIFNKNNEMFVTVLGNAEKKDVPTQKYFVENFLIAE